MTLVSLGTAWDVGSSGSSSCQQLKLRMAGPPQRVTLDFTILLTVQTMNFLHSGRHRVAL